MLIQVVVCILCVVQVISGQVEILPYTMVAYTTNGAPCIGGCSPVTHQCVDSWPPKTSPCVIYNMPAPRFRTTSTSQYCLSNCGRFAWGTAWCYVDSMGTWTSCDEGEASINLLPPTTTTAKPTTTTTKPTSTTTIPIATVKEPATKVPILPRSYTTSAQSQKGSCDSFFRKLSEDYTEWNQHTTAYDGFIEEKADAIERYAETSSDIQVKRIDEQDIAVKSYTLVNLVLPNGRNVSIPVVLRARITNNTLKNFDTAERFGDVSENVGELYEAFYNRRLIGTDIGGINDSYNYVPQSGALRNVLTNIEQVVRCWCIDGKESVDMVIVVFYPEIPTRMPHAIGLDLTFNNRDDSVFVRCRDSLYFNLL